MKYIDKKRLKDPKMWFMKAYAYASTTSIIRREDGKVLYRWEDPELKINAIRAVPYLTGLTGELFMKGYLISKGVLPKNVKKFGHNLKRIREECLKFGDERFKDSNLIFLTDHCGEHLMEEGGIRYPDRREMAAFPQFEDAIVLLEEVCGSI